MTDFVLIQNNTTDTSCEYAKKAFLRCIRYAEFLQMPLTLGMFVPVDDDGDILSEPVQDEYWEDTDIDYYESEMLQYHEANEKVLFSGFSIAWNGEAIISVYLDDLNLAFDKITLKSGMNYTIEHLCTYDLELTPYALKQIGI
ncbi:hypothetical protein BN1195_03629 [Chryseobacterium oranimense G311]|nr:hypothetical protein BN1195_03629 [Chryseobacterium oranimense G311]